MRKIALKLGWLDPHREIPSDDELAKVFKPSAITLATQSSVYQYQQQIADWCQQGIQASTMHAALQRQYGFTGSYECGTAVCKKIKESYPQASQLFWILRLVNALKSILVPAQIY